MKGCAIAFPTEQLNAVAEAFDGSVGFYAEDLTTGSVYASNPDRRHATVSVCKVPILVELYHQAKASTLRLDQRHRLRDDVTRHGTGCLKILRDQPELSLYDYARLMIMVSDNAATDMINDVIGIANINERMDALGYPNTRVNWTMTQWQYLIVGMHGQPQTIENNCRMERRMAAGAMAWESVAYTDSIDSNVTTPREIASILKQIHRREMVSTEASQAMLALLRGCSDRSMIPAHLRSDVAVAHKVGFSRRLKADVGIVFAPSGPVVIAGMTMAATDDDPGARVIASMSRLAVQAVSPESIDERTAGE